VTGPEPAASGFRPPPYPYARLEDLRAEAAALFGADGVVDCSVGTPCDPPPAAVHAAMAGSDADRGYPPASGSAAYRRAAADWVSRRFGVTVDPDRQVAACVGTKEMVASTAHYLRLRTPERDTVLYPEVSYPTYAMGALLAGCRAVAVVERPGGGPDLAAVAAGDAARALLLWTNSPSNPTGRLTDHEEVAAWARRRGIPVFSDECYAEFTWEGRPRSLLETGTEGAVAVHSLSKRSNLAGARAGFFAGDAELVGYLADVRRHAGLMVPGPTQDAAVVAWDDDGHVDEQRARYLDRLGFLAATLSESVCPAALPDGAFYLWVAVPPAVGDGWDLAALLARRAGLLVSPGEFYGPAGAGSVRVAAVQPMDRLGLVASRLGAAADEGRTRSAQA
jgi:aspartate/methionine/tyrosine aminotransferase